MNFALVIMIVFFICAVAFSIFIAIRAKSNIAKIDKSRMELRNDPFWKFTIKTSVVDRAKNEHVWDMDNPTWTTITYKKVIKND